MENARRLLVSLAVVAAASLAVVGCTPAAPAPAPTSAPVATRAPAAQPTAVPTSAPPAQPTAVPTKAAAAQPTAVPAKKVDFPEKGRTITMIVGWAAGGGTDIAARLLAAPLEKELGVPIQVVNKPGAGSQVGATDLANAKPDGYTIGVVSPLSLIVIYLDPSLGATFNRKSFEPVANHVWDAMAIGVKSDSPYKTTKDLMEAARAKPETITISTTGQVGVNPFSLTMLEKQAGVKFRRVAFDAVPAQLTALLGGHTDAAFAGIAGWVSALTTGECRLLGYTGTQQSKLYPDVKPFSAQGYSPGLPTVQGVAAPAGTPKEIIDILSRAMKKVVESDDFAKKVTAQNVTPYYMDPQQFGDMWQDYEQQIAQIMKETS